MFLLRRFLAGESRCAQLLTRVVDRFSRFFRFNSIQALSETSLAGLSKLELLMLHGNNIASIPDGALRDLGSLQVRRGAREHPPRLLIA